MMLDLAVQNGRIYDPETKSTRIGSIGIENGRIACIESHALTAKTEIWAEQADVVPGFIDIHMHEGSLINGIIDATIGRAMIHMGVTTVVGGNCGYSPDSIKAYFAAVQKAGSPVNVALLYGYNGIRRSLCEANGAMEFRGDDVYLHFSRDEIARSYKPVCFCAIMITRSSPPTIVMTQNAVSIRYARRLMFVPRRASPFSFLISEAAPLSVAVNRWKKR